MAKCVSLVCSVFEYVSLDFRVLCMNAGTEYKQMNKFACLSPEKKMITVCTRERLFSTVNQHVSFQFISSNA